MLFREELLLILGLSMDGFAASVCLGAARDRRGLAPVVLCVTGFHVGMLLAGWVLGAGVRGLCAAALPWAAGLILLFLGAEMLRTADREEAARPGGTPLSLAAPALATSVDALTVGAALALTEAAPLPAAGLTAAVMGALSLAGAALGGRVGQKHRRAARLAGGAILAALGFKTLLGAML